MSPDYAANWGMHVSSKSNMFSFGVIIMEMVTGRRNNNSAYDSMIDSVFHNTTKKQFWRHADYFGSGGSIKSGL